MAKVPFKYYMHDNYTHSERISWISEQTGLDIDPDGELANKIDRPFCEIELNCTLDTETGAVEITGVKA